MNFMFNSKWRKKKRGNPQAFGVCSPRGPANITVNLTKKVRCVKIVMKKTLGKGISG